MPEREGPLHIAGGEIEEQDYELWAQEVELLKPGEECGVFGVYSEHPKVDVVAMALNAAHEHQHRGQEAAGVAVSGPDGILRRVGAGLVKEVFGDPQHVAALGEGHIATSHTRYSTIGDADPNLVAQPIEMPSFDIALNGHHQDWVLDKIGAPNEENASDTRRLALFIQQIYETEGEGDMERTLRIALPRLLPGAFSMVIQTQDQLFAVRDPWGFRPLNLGRNGNSYAVGSETGSLFANDFEFSREVSPGEMLVIDSKGARPVFPFEETSENLCAMEFAYFSAPAAEIWGIEAQQYRLALGRALRMQDQKEFPDVEFDIVTGIPDSGVPSAQGYAEEAGVTYTDVFMRSRYQGRIFIKPVTENRRESVGRKLTPFKSVADGKRILVVDDSVVRGDTSAAFVRMLYDAGATEVHVRSAMPQMTHGCHMGMDTYGAGELLADRHEGDIEAMRDEINATTLNFLDLATMRDVMENPDSEHIRYRAASRIGPGTAAGTQVTRLCTACMDGDYAIPVKVSNRRR